MNFEELKNFDIQEFVESVNNLDQDNIGSWPLAVKALIYALIFFVVLGGGFYFQIKGMNEELSREQSKELDLLSSYEKKAFTALNLQRYKEQLTEMDVSFGALLKQLPSETEVPGLVEDISHTGLGSGLEFKKITLGKESAKEFYMELPIAIEVRGDYHSFGSFVSGVSALPRIVTLHNLSIKPEGGKSKLLLMSVTARTYRYKKAKK